MIALRVWRVVPETAILVMLAMLSCTNSGKNTGQEATGHQLKIDSVLALHFNALEACLQSEPGKPYNVEQLQAAIAFMEDVTGIESRASHTSAGNLWIESQDLKSWRSWIREHRQSLRWDSQGDSVVVAATGSD